MYKPEVNPDPETSSSDSSETSSLESRAKTKKKTKNKKRRKHRKYDTSDPSSSNDSDSSDDSHYRFKWRNNKKHQKNDLIRICATLTAKLMTTAYKSKNIRFKMDEDPLHSRIYILEFIDSLDMKLQSHYTNMTFADNNRYDRTFQQVTDKGGESAINYIKRF